MSVLLALPAAALIAATSGVTSTSAAPAEVAQGEFLFTTADSHGHRMANPPAGKCIKLPDQGSTNGTNVTNRKAHIFATFVSATDCRQELASAEKNSGRGTPWSTPDFRPTAHAVRFDCENPSVC
ncbi:hypothetical protein SMD11_6919 [Streptomyces albireticuli]|uniref:Secreted protein n=1 Tax=Streptomyces albireticuli TaxID=1940 RepID=A0A1Z2LDZ9_9ACTN|nr:hypothetical protein [Streptomyces albireticuli]ARZ72495.1 hypothetical protein SMD11_6919 [Streptomyces albireticuli]